MTVAGYDMDTEAVAEETVKTIYGQGEIYIVDGVKVLDSNGDAVMAYEDAEFESFATAQ